MYACVLVSRSVALRVGEKPLQPPNTTLIGRSLLNWAHLREIERTWRGSRIRLTKRRVRERTGVCTERICPGHRRECCLALCSTARCSLLRCPCASWGLHTLAAVATNTSLSAAAGEQAKSAVVSLDEDMAKMQQETCPSYTPEMDS